MKIKTVFLFINFSNKGERSVIVKKVSKQELKEKTAAVKKILEIQGGSYDEWLLEKQNEFINDNLSSLIDMACKKENKETRNNFENKNGIQRGI